MSAQTRRFGKKKTRAMPPTRSAAPNQTISAPGSRATIRPVNWRSRSKVNWRPAMVDRLALGHDLARDRRRLRAGLVDLDLHLAGLDVRVDLAGGRADRRRR